MMFPCTVKHKLDLNVKSESFEFFARIQNSKHAYLNCIFCLFSIKLSRNFFIFNILSNFNSKVALVCRLSYSCSFFCFGKSVMRNSECIFSNNRSVHWKATHWKAANPLKKISTERCKDQLLASHFPLTISARKISIDKLVKKLW